MFQLTWFATESSLRAFFFCPTILSYTTFKKQFSRNLKFTGFDNYWKHEKICILKVMNFKNHAFLIVQVFHLNSPHQWKPTQTIFFLISHPEICDSVFTGSADLVSQLTKGSMFRQSHWSLSTPLSRLKYSIIFYGMTKSVPKYRQHNKNINKSGVLFHFSLYNFKDTDETLNHWK